MTGTLDAFREAEPERWRDAVTMAIRQRAEVLRRRRQRLLRELNQTDSNMEDLKRKARDLGNLNLFEESS